MNCYVDCSLMKKPKWFSIFLCVCNWKLNMSIAFRNTKTLRPRTHLLESLVSFSTHSRLQLEWFKSFIYEVEKELPNKIFNVGFLKLPTEIDYWQNSRWNCACKIVIDPHLLSRNFKIQGYSFTNICYSIILVFAFLVHNCTSEIIGKKLKKIDFICFFPNFVFWGTYKFLLLINIYTH